MSGHGLGKRTDICLTHRVKCTDQVVCMYTHVSHMYVRSHVNLHTRAILSCDNHEIKHCTKKAVTHVQILDIKHVTNVQVVIINTVHIKHIFVC